MEFTELTDYPVPEGALTEWFPTTSGPWIEDRRRTAYVQEARLRRTAGDGRGLSWLGSAFEISGMLDPRAFSHALRAWVDRHEVLRTRTDVADGDGTGAGDIERRTVPTGSVSFDRIVYATRSMPNVDRLQRIFDDRATPRAWPSYVFATVERADRFTVFFAGDHAILDGFSIVLVAHELTTLYQQARSGDGGELPPVGSYVDYGDRERSSPPAPGTARRAVDIWRAALDGAGLPEFPLEIGPRTSLPQTGVSTWLLDASGDRGFGEACRAAGVGFFPGLLACLAQAGLDVAGRDTFRTVTPVHTRHEPEWAAAMGWFVGLSPLEFRVEDSSFASTAQRASAAVDRAKPAGAFAFDRVERILGTSITPHFVVSYLDVRFLPGAHDWPDINARALRSRQYTHDVYAWINRTPDGVNIAMRFPDNGVAAGQVRAWISAVRARMEQVADTYPSVGLRSRYP
ncbi:condensation domain-containing protein [Rhodococcus sp. HNM0569]|uniref:condensation domain-containing protein n=1 Tax=Rhodococcus sp. HNM0569 TaxID=2716340 RepID=UPI00146B3DE4|nr:condensation domain-containing protein [Rhodococcus sp. HNM0569]NLU81883.1 condensation protein [Rhodococcus sp. HNM0569]